MVVTPKPVEEWDKPLAREEKVWIAVAVVVALVMAVTTLAWDFIDPRHRVPTEAVAISPAEFSRKASEFVRSYSDKVVPEGVDIYLQASQWIWRPAELKLKAGVTYKIWVSSTDVIHGLSILGEDGTVYNIMVMPGMAYAIHIRFDKPGEYEIICNEYCGIGHSEMHAKILVVR